MVISQWKRRLKGLLKAKGHIDAIAGNRILGWAFADGAPVTVEAAIGGDVIARTQPHIDRADIAGAFPGWRRAGRSGFVLDLPGAAFPDGTLADVTITVRAQSPIHIPRQLTKLAMTGPATLARVMAPTETGIIGPFPRPVIDAVAALWPDAASNLMDVTAQAAFVDKVLTFVESPTLRANRAIADYVRYMQAVWTHCHFVERFFPAVNATAREGSTDFSCKPNSVEEIFAIAHQLYVLKSYGIAGDFAEFGCFKGFSSAMLSFACRELGIPMHIFDSFEGLPPAEGSGYQPGEYAGSLEEVTANVTQFGAIDTVEFHQGFFSDSLRDYRPPQLMCLWMDVDLEVSARDLMIVADRLDPRATLFSHESSPDMFVGDTVVSAPRLDNPIPPMLDRFAALQRPLRGRFLRGTTGAFWPREDGIPAVDNAVLIDFARRLAA